MLPNLFTLGALFGGFYAVVMAMNGRFEQAAYGVFAAMVLDSLDGRVARMTEHAERIRRADRHPLRHGLVRRRAGADRLRVGAARPRQAGWIAAFVYCACAALRLARFNTNIDVVDKRFFQGLPSPAAAALVMGFIWVMDDLGFTGIEQALARLGTFALHAVRRPDDGHQRAVLQLQGHQPEALGAVRRHRADRARHRRHQHPPADRAVRRCSWSTASPATRCTSGRSMKGKPVSVIATSTDEPDEQGLHR